MEQENLYSLLVGISQDVGELKGEVKQQNSDMKALQTRMDNIKLEFVKADEKITSKLEEYFEYAKNRQDSIKEGLEVSIKDHETRISNLENKTKNSLWAFFEKFKVALISAIILTLVGACMKFATEVIVALKNPIVTTEEVKK